MKNSAVVVKQEVSNRLEVVTAGQGHVAVVAVHRAVEAGVAAEAAVDHLVVATEVPVEAGVLHQQEVRANTAVTVTEGRRTRRRSSGRPAALMKIEGALLKKNSWRILSKWCNIIFRWKPYFILWIFFFLSCTISIDLTLKKIQKKNYIRCNKFKNFLTICLETSWRFRIFSMYRKPSDAPWSLFL